MSIQDKQPGVLECMYYLVREMDGLGIRAGEKHFEDALQHVREHGLKGLRDLEIEALYMAAKLRSTETVNRVKELDAAVDLWEGVE